MTTAPEFLAGAAVEVVIFGIAGALLYRLWHRVPFLPQRTHLLPFHRGVLFQGEKLVRVVEPGKHWVMPKQTLTPIDIRPKPLQIAPHDLIAQDGRAIRIALGGEFRVVDPALYLSGNANSTGAFFVALEQALPLAISEYTSEAILHDPSVIASRIRERMEPRCAQLGLALTMLDVHSVLPLYSTAPAG